MSDGIKELEENKNRVEISLRQTTKSKVDMYCFFTDGSGETKEVSRKNKRSLEELPHTQWVKQEEGTKVIFNNITLINYILVCVNMDEPDKGDALKDMGVEVTITNTKKQKVSVSFEKRVESEWGAIVLITQQDGKISAESVETYSTEQEFSREFKKRTGKKPSRFFSRGVNVEGVSRYNKDRRPKLFEDGSFMMSIGRIKV